LTVGRCTASGGSQNFRVPSLSEHEGAHRPRLQAAEAADAVKQACGGRRERRRQDVWR
jgi:hypothetical protein